MASFGASGGNIGFGVAVGLYDFFTGPAYRIQRSMKSLQISTTGFANSMDKQLRGIKATFAFFAASAGVAALAAAPVMLASKYEALETQFEVMLNSATLAKKTLTELRNFAKSTPFGVDETTKAAKQLLAFGIEQKHLMQDMKMLGDISSAVGKENLEPIILAYGQARTKGFLMGDELRQFAERGVPIMDVLQRQLGTKDGNATFDAIKKRQVSFEMLRGVFKELTTEGGRFANMMQKLEGKTSQVIDRLGGEFYEITLKFGQAMMEAAKPTLEVTAAIVSLVNDISPTMLGAVASKVILLTSAFASLASAVYLVNKIPRIGRWLAGSYLDAMGQSKMATALFNQGKAGHGVGQINKIFNKLSQRAAANNRRGLQNSFAAMGPSANSPFRPSNWVKAQAEQRVGHITNHAARSITEQEFLRRQAENLSYGLAKNAGLSPNPNKQGKAAKRASTGAFTSTVTSPAIAGTKHWSAMGNTIMMGLKGAGKQILSFITAPMVAAAQMSLIIGNIGRLYAGMILKIALFAIPIAIAVAGFLAFQEVLKGTSPPADGFLGLLQKVGGAISGVIALVQSWNGERALMDLKLASTLSKLGILEVTARLSVWAIRLKEILHGVMTGLLFGFDIISSVFNAIAYAVTKLFSYFAQLFGISSKIAGDVRAWRLLGWFIGVYLAASLARAAYGFVIMGREALIAGIKSMLSLGPVGLVILLIVAAVGLLIWAFTSLFDTMDEGDKHSNPFDRFTSGIDPTKPIMSGISNSIVSRDIAPSIATQERITNLREIEKERRMQAYQDKNVQVTLQMDGRKVGEANAKFTRINKAKGGGPE